MNQPDASVALLSMLGFENTVTPCRSHVPTSPEGTWCQRISVFPSRLKSPVPTTFQPDDSEAAQVMGLDPSSCVPFKNQTDSSPLTGLCQSTSVLRSPLKSPVPTTFHPDELARPMLRDALPR